MVRITFFILISIASIYFAQSGLSIPQNPLGPLAVGKYPPPDWIKPGVVLVYHVEGGSRTAGEGSGSALYSTGFIIMIVTNVVRNSVYGITLSCFTRPDIMLTPPQVYVLNGIAFVTPREIEDILSRRDEYAKDGIAVGGGKTENGYFLTVSYKTSTTMIEVDETGKVIQFSFRETNPSFSQVAMGRFLEQTRANWIFTDSFPRVAMGSYTYTLGSYSPITGYASSIGTSKISFLNVRDGLALYDQTITIQDPSSGIPIHQTNRIFGVPSYGPFYVHPDLLRVQTIIEIPGVNFRWYNEPSQLGYGIDSVIEVNGVEILRTTFDEEGLTIKSILYSMGIYMMAELQMSE